MKEAMLEIEHQRCQVDPIYCLLTNPSYVQPGDTVPFVDGLMELSIAYIQQRYGDRLMCNHNVQRIYGLLTVNRDIDPVLGRDDAVKVFALMFIFKWERELAQCIERMYNEEHPACVYSRNQFNRLLSHLGQYIDKTLEFPYNKCNIVEIVKQFLLACKKQYLMNK